MQVQYHSQVQPPLARPNITDIACPLLVGRISVKVTIQQVWRDIELMIAVRCRLVFTSSYDRYAVLTHQPAYAAVPYIQTNFLQIFGHTRPAITAQTETGLFFDMGQRDQIRPLPAAGWTATMRPQTTRADCHNPAHQIDGKCCSVFFNELKPHGFWLAKNTVAFLRNSHVGL